MTRPLRRLAAALAAVVLLAGAPAARATAGTVVADGGSGNGIASGAVVRSSPDGALVTVTNGFHFWAALEVTYVGGASLRAADLREDFGGIYAGAGLIGPGSTAAWDGTFAAGSQALVRVHYDLSSARGGEALAANLLTIIADSLGASLSASSSGRLLSALQLLTGMSSWADLVRQAQTSDIWGLATSIEVLLGTKTGRDAIRQALAQLSVAASDADLVKAASVVGVVDWAWTLFDIYRAVLLGQNDGTVIFSVAPPAAAATPAPAPAATPTATPAATPGATPRPTATPKPTSKPTPSPTSTCNFVYASGWQGQGVYQLDPARKRIVATAKTSLFNNRYLAWNAIRDEIYVLADNGGVISVVAASPFREVATISTDVGWNGHSIAVSPDGRTIVATFANGDPANGGLFRRVVEYDAATRRMQHAVVLAKTYGSSYAAFSPDSRRVYVSWDNHIDTYDTASMARLDRITGVTTGSGRLSVSPDGRYLFIVQANTLVKYDLRVGQAADSVSVDVSGGDGFAWSSLSRDGRAVWVLGNNEVTRVPLSLGAAKPFDAAAPIGFSESTDGSRLFVSDVDGTNVSTINLVTGRVASSMPVANATSLVAVPCR